MKIDIYTTNRKYTSLQTAPPNGGYRQPEFYHFKVLKDLKQAMFVGDSIQEPTDLHSEEEHLVPFTVY